MACDQIPTISISNNFGSGTSLYDLSIDVNFNSPTTFQASFVNKEGIYNNLDSYLSTEDAATLTIDGTNFNIYPVTYKITESPAGKLLAVKYVDASVKWLDKKVVGFDFLEDLDNILPIIPTTFDAFIPTESSQESGLEIGKYTPEVLQKGMSNASIPMSQKVISFLQKFKEIKGNDKISAVSFDTVGTVRSALSSISSVIGVLFYWNWAVGGDGQLDVFDTKISNISSLSNSLKQLAKKTSIDESGSIEDNINSMELIYDTSYQSIIPDKYLATFYMLDLMRGSKNFEPNYWASAKEGKYIQKRHFQTRDFYRLCAAALAGKDFFDSYVLWHLSIGSYKNYGLQELLTQLDGTAEVVPNFSLSDITYYNKSVIGIFEDDFGKLVGESQNPEYIDLESPITNPKINPLCPISILLVKNNEETFQKFVTDLYTTNPLRAHLGSEIFRRKRITNQNPAMFVVCFNKNLLESYINRLFSTCETIGNNLFRWLVTARPPSSNILDSRGGGTETISKQKYQEFAISLPWLYREGGAINTPLNSLALYLIKQKNENQTETEEENKEDVVEDIRIKELLKDGDIETDSILNDDGACKNRGYLIIDSDTNRACNVKNDLKIVQFDLNPADTASAQLINTHGLTHYIIFKTKAKYAGKLSGPSESDVGFKPNLTSKQMLERVKTILFRKINQNKIGTWDWRYIDLGSTNSKSMSNYLNVLKAPFLRHSSLNNSYSQIDNFDTLQPEEIGEGGRCDVEEGIAPSSDITITKQFDLDQWEKDIAAYKINNLDINKNITVNIAGLVTPENDWIQNGLESYSVSISQNGITTNISAGSRKKSAQSFENYTRYANSPVGGGEVKTKINIPSSNRRASQKNNIEVYQ